MLEINGSLFIQIGNFLVLLFLLNILLFRPIRGILQRRSDELAALEKAVADYEGRSGQGEKRMEDSLVAARKEGFSSKEKLRGEGLNNEKEILKAAGASAETKMLAARKDIESRMTEVRRALNAEIRMFSKELAEKILGRAV